MMAVMPDRSPGTAGEYARILADNARYAAAFGHGGLAPPPTRRLAVLACMDARLTVEAALGLSTGEAHILRNAGGIATEDVIRSLVVSQNLLGTEEVVVVGHTQCGMLGFRADEVRRELVETTGAAVDLDFHAFTDLEATVREQVRRIHVHPWTKDVPVYGLVYDVATGRLRQVV